MKAEDILAKDDFKKCVDFHGHLCPGLSMGYKASLTGMEWLRASRASDEEVVAMELPPKAKIEPSNPCGRCGEPVMASKLTEVNGLMICRGCQALL